MSAPTASRRPGATTLRRPNFTTLTLLTALCCAASGCGPNTSRSDRATVKLTPDQLANMTYEGIEERPIELTNGHYLGEPFVESGASRPSVELLDEVTAYDDLDGDGIDEAAVLLAQNSGGSGTYIWLAVVGTRSGTPATYGTALVGDRPQIRSLRILDHHIRLELVDRGPSDPACCPTRFWTKEWALGDDELTEVAAKMGGPLSLAALSGHDWILTHLDIEKPAPPQPEITIRFEEGKIAGSAGCNGYFADLTERSPGAVSLGPLSSTRMMCPTETMLLELSYLDRLGQVNQYGYWMGKLALTWQADDGFGSFLFTPRPAAGTGEGVS